MTSKLVGTAFNAALAEQGGSVPVWLILSSLKHGRWTTQLDLARSLGIEGPTLTRHLDNLEAGRLGRPAAFRRRPPCGPVELTAAGEESYERLLGGRDRVQSSAPGRCERRGAAGLVDDF